MGVQVFRGRTLKEAQRAAFQRLGADAVVITTRSVRRDGLSGLFGGSDVEVAAMVAANDPPRAAPSVARFAPSVYGTDSSSRARPSDIGALRAELKNDMRALKTLIAKVEDSSPVARELTGIRELIESMGAPAAQRGDRAATRIRNLGVEGPAAATLARALRDKGTEGSAVEAMRGALSQLLKATEWPVESQRAVVGLIGPTGAGKTTTAAKLAARVRMDGRSVTLVCCDTFRVGAVEQLARYAQLMQAEFATARTSEELYKVIETSRTDVVVVDTSGRSPAPDGVETALCPTSGSRRSIPRARHVLLCTPASVRAADAARVAKRYRVLSPTSLAVTKFDETDAPAGLVHATWASRLPISVVCFGQRVPEDIAPATGGALLDYLVPKRDGKAATA